MRIKYLSIRAIRHILILLPFGVVSLAHSNDSLIAFGQACLATEAQLKRTQLRLTDRTLNKEFNYSALSSSNREIQDYQHEKDRLEASLEECASSTPNSAFCHQARQRDNELTYLLNKAKAASIKEQDIQTESTNNEKLRHQFDEDYARFIAHCRDSDAHYALIQNPTAYQAVCSEKSAKHSVTCSFF